MDTTLRDGEQTQGVSYSPDEKLNIAKALLQALQVDRIEVASAANYYRKCRVSLRALTSRYLRFD
jgi:isopropylmalate/homocitrate/citramalate synthase